MYASKWFLMILSAALLVQPAVAGDCASRNGDPGCGAGGCCDDGCGPCLTCKLVNTTKKITVTCYGVKEDPVCLPCPSCKGCTNCEHLCAQPGCSCSESCDCRPDCRVRWTEWCPCGAEMYCRKKLIKYEATKEIPWFKWVVVQDGCGGSGCCEGAGQPVAPPAATPKPAADPAPKPAASKAAGITRPAPKGARVGDEFEVSEGDMKILQASYNRAPAAQVAPVAQASVQQPPFQPVAFAPAAVQSAPAAKAPAARTSGTQRLYDLIK